MALGSVGSTALKVSAHLVMSLMAVETSTFIVEYSIDDFLLAKIWLSAATAYSDIWIIIWSLLKKKDMNK